MIKINVKKEWHGAEVKIKGNKAINKSIYEIGLIIEGQAKELAARNYGYMAASINTQSFRQGTELELPNKYSEKTAELYFLQEGAGKEPEGFRKIKSPMKENEVLVGTAVFYACVFGGKTTVKIKENNKFKNRAICQIKKGDFVLTQTGEYHEVTEIFRKPAVQLSDLIEIICEYRRDKTHKLIVTKEHKLLVFREGRNKWVKAEDLLLTDTLFSLKKKGIKVEKSHRNCIECNKLFYPQNKSNAHKFCSQKCRIKYWSENGNPNIGSKRTKKTRAKMSLLKKEYFEINPEKHPNRIMNKKGYQTDVEKQIEQWLIDRKVKYEKQKNIGKVYVDFYLSKTNEIIEGDGAFWHSNQKRDIERDKYIKEILPDVKITHMHFYDKRFSKNIKVNPLENVYYRVCNPGVNSYVNMNDFENKKIVSIKSFKYGGNIKKHGSTQAYVYDLSVDKVHSYYANGILVSNSYVEFGTVKMNSQPFLRPALDLSRGKVLTLLWDGLKYYLGDYLLRGNK
jgi:very-short-patch-repair endonuclease/phage gpG-like protein